MMTLDKIVVPVDFSACSLAALDYGIELARRFAARVDVLHVWNAPVIAAYWGPVIPPDFDVHPLLAFERSTAGTAMKDLLAHYEHADVVVRGRLESGDAIHAIVETAGRDGYDLIVMGTHGRTGMSHFLLGSIAEAVVRRAPCPVITIRAPGPEAVVTHGGHRDELDDEEEAMPHNHGAAR